MVNWLLVSVMSGVLLFGCRASNPHDEDSDLASTEEKLWFGADGSAQACEPPAAACSNFQDDKEFVDMCVEKGFQARTCGCALRCSGKLDYVYKAPPPSGPTNGNAVTVQACPSDHASEVERTLKDLNLGGALGRCLDAHLCNGVLGSCQGEELKTSMRLRELSRNGCEDEVVGVVCRNGFVDSLQCPEPDIELLSQTWAAFRSKDVAVKRCMRKLVCTGDKGGCSPDHLRQAQKVKTAMDNDGCEYWLRQYCSFGGSAW